MKSTKSTNMSDISISSSHVVIEPNVIPVTLSYILAGIDYIIDESPYNASNIPLKDIEQSLHASMDARLASKEAISQHFNYFRTRADKIIGKVLLDSLFGNNFGAEAVPLLSDLNMIGAILKILLSMQKPSKGMLFCKLVSNEMILELLKNFNTLRFHLIHKLDGKPKPYTLESMLIPMLNVKSKRRIDEIYSDKKKFSTLYSQYRAINDIIHTVEAGTNPYCEIFKYQYDLFRLGYIVGINSFCHEINLTLNNIILTEMDNITEEDYKCLNEIKDILGKIIRMIRSGNGWRGRMNASQVVKFISNYKTIFDTNNFLVTAKPHSTYIDCSKKTVIRTKQTQNNSDNGYFKNHVQRPIPEPEWVRNFYGTQITTLNDKFAIRKNSITLSDNKHISSVPERLKIEINDESKCKNYRKEVSKRTNYKVKQLAFSIIKFMNLKRVITASKDKKNPINTKNRSIFQNILFK